MPGKLVLALFLLQSAPVVPVDVKVDILRAQRDVVILQLQERQIQDEIQQKTQLIQQEFKRLEVEGYTLNPQTLEYVKK